MTIQLKFLPTVNLPYDNINLATQMMIRLFEKSPYLPLLPNIKESETILNRMFADDKMFTINKKKIKLNINFETYDEECTNHLNTTFNKCTYDNLSKYGFKSEYVEQYFKVIKRLQPEETVVNLVGPFSFACMVGNYEKQKLLTDTNCRKFIVQLITVKALWIISKIKELSPNTKTIIILEENSLNEFAKLKNSNEDINSSNLTTLYTRIIKKIHDNGALVGIQCFNKCNWAPIMDSGVDLISFNAFDNPRNLNIIAKSVNKFIAKGGYINWGVVPVKSEAIIKTLTADLIYKKFIGITNELIASGVSADMLYSHSIVSIQGDISSLSPLFAERALMIAGQLSKKVPTMK